MTWYSLPGRRKKCCCFRFLILIALLAIILLVSGCLNLLRPSVSAKPGEIEQWVEYLASDEMQGRANGSEQMKEAADWIARRFDQFGLRPAPGQESYLQEYSLSRWDGNSVTERNVVGYVEGVVPELKNEYIIVSAHFDHLGANKLVNVDSIYNGADDNASGVATVLGIARALKRMRAKPGRSIVFIAYSGEEIGIQGSRYYSQHPLFALESTWLNINFEMVGQCRNLGKMRYYITGPSYSNIDEIVGQYNSAGQWQIAGSAKNAERLFLASDNKSLAVVKREKGISYGVPAHTFSFYDGEDHLHRPHDEAQFLDYENLASFVNYMAGLVLRLAELQEDVVWTDEYYRRIGEEPQ